MITLVKDKCACNIKEQFDSIYLAYFSRMYRFAKEYVMTDADAENVVQDVFLLLWEKGEFLSVQTSLSAYLYTLTRYRAIDYLRHKMIREDYQEELKLKLQALENLQEHLPSEEEIQRLIDMALAKLPARCREIFVKSRFEGKKYREIAEEMQISVNTVENQMGIALKKMREELKEYLPILIFLMNC